MAFELSDDDLTQAISDTEAEIFSSSTGGDLDPEDVESWDDIIEDQSRMHGWDDSLVDDARLAREATGDTPIGMSMGVDDDDLEAAWQEGYQAGAQALYREIAPHLPQPQRPDMFADPEGWEANMLAQARGQGIPPPNGYGQPLPGKPDMFSDPDGYERWMLAEARRQSGMNEFNRDRINSSMGYAHKVYGPEFERAYSDITQGLDPSNPQHRQLVNDVMQSPDPGMAIMGAANLARAANANAVRYGGSHGANPVFAPGLMPRREPLRNSEGLAPRSREEADELDIWRDATDPGGIWAGF
jgi:hypothetical protein